MSQNVMVTGAGKAVGLGFNLVLRYLEAGDNVAATIRKPCAELDNLKKQYGDRLVIPYICYNSINGSDLAISDNQRRKNI